MPPPVAGKGYHLILTDDAVRHLRFNHILSSKFPFLRAALPALGNCPPCARRSNWDSSQTLQVINGIKQAIANLNDQQKNLFKGIIGVGTVEFYLREPSGVRKITF